MGIFSKLTQKATPKPETPQAQSSADRMILATMVLESINDGVIIVDVNNLVKMINPAATAMLGYNSAEVMLGVNILNSLKFQSSEGATVSDETNEIFKAIVQSECFSTKKYVLVGLGGQHRPVAVTIMPVKTYHGEKVITLRDITKELEKEGEQTEFISTASHEMRTPVASIEGYLGLALNPQCATIDERARKYLEEAHRSSQHLGRLFKDLLDVTKLDDKKAKLRLVPVEMVDLVRKIVEGQVPAMGQKRLKYTFGSNGGMNTADGGGRSLNQTAYSIVDVDFVLEILNNLIENAIKYTKEGGAIWVNVRGDSDRVLVNVTDTGIGISADDLKHIFQKFYRVDNSQTREIGGTGLGLYIVKMRAEAMGGKVWAESSFGEGSTFYLSLPRITFEEYERRKQIIANTEAMTAQPDIQNITQTITPNVTQPMTTPNQGM
jgi:two-component sensor kinase, probably involved in phosphate sensing